MTNFEEYKNELANSLDTCRIREILIKLGCDSREVKCGTTEKCVECYAETIKCLLQEHKEDNNDQLRKI